jgi:signal transduction histidine kinase
LSDASRYVTDNELALLGELVASTKKTLDLIVPDESSILRLQQANIFGAMSTLAKANHASVRVASVFSRKTQGAIREFFPLIKFRSINSSFNDSRLIAIRDNAEVLLLGPRVDANGGGSFAVGGPHEVAAQSMERFDVSSRPLMVWAWSQVFEGLLQQREQLDALVAEKRYAGFLLDLLSHDVGNYNQMLLGLIEQAQGELQQSGSRTETDERVAEMLSKARQGLGRSISFLANVKLLAILHRDEPFDLRPVDLYSCILESEQRINANSSLIHEAPGKDKTLAVRMTNRSKVAFDKPMVLADELLPELFFNLFSNALKNADATDVTVELSVEEKKIGATALCEVCVVDYGTGISDQMKDDVSGAFPDHVNRTGLGLTIIDGLVRRYGGQLWVEDRVKGDPSKGIVFGMLLKKAPDRTNVDRA